MQGMHEGHTVQGPVRATVDWANCNTCKTQVKFKQLRTLLIIRAG